VRCVGNNPSLEQPNLQLWHDDVRPVNQVDWVDCEQVLARIGLVLPHEQQWEYAARAGTSTPWWTGADLASVKAAENLSGKQDGFMTIAPVGSFAPNPFGLYDVLGNVCEWCGNRPYMYGEDPQKYPETMLEHTARGGDNRSPAVAARVSGRRTAQHMTHPSLGVRPVRAIVSGQ
jgi:formylglycine-generating enzyme required for sulfatase activity